MTEGKTYMHMVGVFGWKALRRYMALKRCSFCIEPSRRDDC
ncbi:hypothetical protein PMI26_03633 [Pseudomonas sp. GM33]|nr:hypothetical protein PMI26_03633 [Pseudomonas sp. GM33]